MNGFHYNDNTGNWEVTAPPRYTHDRVKLVIAFVCMIAAAALIALSGCTVIKAVGHEVQSVRPVLSFSLTDSLCGSLSLVDSAGHVFIGPFEYCLPMPGMPHNVAYNPDMPSPLLPPAESEITVELPKISVQADGK